MAVDLGQLLDPKRAEREEGWRDFAQSYDRSMKALSDAIEKLSGKRKLEEGESAFTVLEKYAEEMRNKADLDREKAERLRDIVAASIPEVTAEQKAAYDAQKQLYLQYQDELKKQTKAVEASAKAQAKSVEASAKARIAAIDKEEKQRLSAIDEQAAQLKRDKGSALAKGLEPLVASGEQAAKRGSEDTLVSILLRDAKDLLGKRQSEQDALIDQAAALQREGIKEETQLRKEAIEEEKRERLAAIAEESRERIAAVQKEVQARAKAEGVEKAPEAPEAAREKMIAEAVGTLARNKKLLERSAVMEPVAKKQREALEAEIRLEAVEEQGGEYLAPAVEEAPMPGEAAQAPVEIKQEAVEAPKPQPASEPTRQGQGTSIADVVPAPEPKAVASSPTREAAVPPVSKEKAVEKATTGAADVLKGSKGLGTFAKSAASTESLAAIAGGVGKLVPQAAAVAIATELGVRALKDIDETLPVASSGLNALGDMSRLVGPAILSLGMELGGYILEMGNTVAEAVESLLPGQTRQERVEGLIVQERKKAEGAKAADEKRMEAIRGADAGSLSSPAEWGPVQIERIQPIYTPPSAEQPRPISAESAQVGTESQLQGAVASMLEAQQRAFAHQAQLGQGTTTLMMSNPSLEPFPV